MTLTDNFPLMNIKKWNDLKYVLNTQFLNLLDPIANDKFPVISTLNTLRHSSKIVSKLFLPSRYNARYSPSYRSQKKNYLPKRTVVKFQEGSLGVISSFIENNDLIETKAAG